jgi:hypothetical protein
MHEKVSCKYHAALVSELASLNSNVRALTEAIVSSLKQLENRLQRRMDAEETPAANTSIGKMTNLPPLLQLAIRKARIAQNFILERILRVEVRRW